MCEDLFDLVAGPIHQALKNANMRISEIDQIIIVGGGVRYVRIWIGGRGISMWETFSRC